MTTEENRAHHVHHATLQKQLHLRAVLLFGLAYMTPIIVLGIFGVIAVKSNGASAGSYLLATVAMLFTALSYGLMAKHFPVAGSAYTYVRKSLDSRLGFVVGWAILLDYLFLPLVIWLIGGAYLQGQFPGVPFWVWIVAYIVLTSALNVIGLKVADRTNFVLMTVQLLILLFFVILSITHLVSGSQSLVSVTPFVGGGGFSAIAAGAAVAAYSFLGFDAISTLTEETYDAERTIPKAIVLVAFIGGAIFIVVTYFVTLVSPGGTFDNADSLAADIAKTIGGSLFGAVFLTGLIVGQFTSVPGGSGRRRSVAVCNGSRQCVAETPLRLGVRAVPHPGVQHRPGRNHRARAIFLDVATSTSFINFGAFTAFALVNLSVIGYFLRHRGDRLSPWRYILLPVIGAIIDIYLLTQLDSKALILGLSWLGIGIVYLLVLTRGLTREPPEMTAIAEAE